MLRSPPDWTTLRIFLAALELGSIVKAARVNGIANSAAAKRLQLLEQDAQVALLERGARGVRATPAGELLARHARTLVDYGSRLAGDVNAFAAGGIGTVRLSTAPSAMLGGLLAERLAAFQRDNPMIICELSETMSTTILQDVAEGRSDLGIVTTGIRIPAGLEAAPWHEDRLIVAVARHHPLAGSRRLRYAACLDHQIVVLMEFGSLSILLADEAVKRGRSLDGRYRVNNMDSARYLVASGLAIGIMPEGMVQPYEETLGLSAIPLIEDWAVRRLRLVWRSDAIRSAPTQKLRRHLVDAAAPFS